jgi:hypothetical protein
VASIDSTAIERSVITFTSLIEDNQDISLGLVEDAPQTYISIRTTLNASTDLLTSPILETLQIKATPHPHIQRNIRSRSTSRTWRWTRTARRSDSRARRTFASPRLEQLENDNSVVAILDRTSGESYSAQIRKVQFIRTTPPSKNKKNFGGVVLVDVLKL